jgi:chemotaxis regulatin CheY-phosphate phosphatase CheZ
MSAIAKMQEYCNATKADWTEYTELLKADDPSSAERLGQLMVKLQRSLSDVQADKAILSRTLELRGAIGAARGVASRVKAAERSVAEANLAAIKAHQGIDDQLRVQAQQLASLLNTVSVGEDAVEELNQLRQDNPELLQNEPAVQPSELT